MQKCKSGRGGKLGILGSHQTYTKKAYTSTLAQHIYTLSSSNQRNTTLSHEKTMSIATKEDLSFVNRFNGKELA